MSAQDVLAPAASMSRPPRRRDVDRPARDLRVGQPQRVERGPLRQVGQAPRGVGGEQVVGRETVIEEGADRGAHARRSIGDEGDVGLDGGVRRDDVHGEESEGRRSQGATAIARASRRRGSQGREQRAPPA